MEELASPSTDHDITHVPGFAPISSSAFQIPPIPAVPLTTALPLLLRQLPYGSGKYE